MGVLFIPTATIVPKRLSDTSLMQVNTTRFPRVARDSGPFAQNLL